LKDPRRLDFDGKGRDGFVTALSVERKLLKAVEAIYDSATEPQQWRRTLGLIAECFGDRGAILLWRRDDGSYGTFVSEGLIEAQKDYEESGWTVRDIAATRVTERGYFFSGEPFTNRHLVSRDEMRRDPFFLQFRTQHGLGPFGGIAVSPDPHVGVILSMQRHPGQSEYSDDELALLSNIGRHIEKSLRLSMRLLDAELAKLGLGDALARIGVGVFALDSLGRVVFSNPAARQMTGDRLQIINGRLRIGLGAARDEIDGVIANTLRGDLADLIGDPQPILVHSTSSNHRLVVYLLPVSVRMGLAEEFLTHTRAFVLALEQKLDDPADPAVVRDVLGLTLGEARIAALVGAGLPPREAALRLGIAEDTARNVLKRVFSKVGVSRQSELVALLGKLVLHPRTRAQT
jgi:DNA-binding CsgD family transcriptional regulator/PAS domain-containing protein